MNSVESQIPGNKGNNEVADFSVQETILEQLRASKVNGFPFLAYTGIRNYVMAGDNPAGNPQLKLDCPSNPRKVTHIWITYLRGDDLYELAFCRDNNNFNLTHEEGAYHGIFSDQMAEIIAEEMGVK